MGVDYELFWTLNPKTLKPFIKAFSLKQRQDDFLAWQQGAYIRLAIASVFAKSEKVKYPPEPLGEKQYKKKVKQPSQQDLIKEKMMERMRAINQRFRKEE